MAPQSASPLMAPDADVMFHTLQASMSGDKRRTVTCDLSTEPDAGCVAGCRQWLLDQLMELQRQCAGYTCWRCMPAVLRERPRPTWNIEIHHDNQIRIRLPTCCHDHVLALDHSATRQHFCPSARRASVIVADVPEQLDFALETEPAHQTARVSVPR
jgi:hypothetical protein